MSLVRQSQILCYYLNCLFDNNYSGVATAAAVVPVVTVSIVGAVTLLLLLYYYQLRQSLIVIRFSNPDEPGSLAQMLKVFKVI